MGKARKFVLFVSPFLHTIFYISSTAYSLTDHRPFKNQNSPAALRDVW